MNDSTKPLTTPTMAFIALMLLPVLAIAASKVDTDSNIVHGVGIVSGKLIHPSTGHVNLLVASMKNYSAHLGQTLVLVTTIYDMDENVRAGGLKVVTVKVTPGSTQIISSELSVRPSARDTIKISLSTERALDEKYSRAGAAAWNWQHGHIRQFGHLPPPGTMSCQQFMTLCHNAAVSTCRFGVAAFEVNCTGPICKFKCYPPPIPHQNG